MPLRNKKVIYEPYYDPIRGEYHTPDGTHLERTTNIIKYSLNLYQWGNTYYAERGTAIHLACQYDDENRLDEATINQDCKENLDQYRKAKRELGIKILQNEVRRYHPKYLYAGTIDKLAIINGHNWLIDIKTGNQEIWHKWQTAAYKELINDEFNVERRGCLYIKNDIYELVEYDYKMDFQEFLALSIAYQISKKYGYIKQKRRTK